MTLRTRLFLLFAGLAAALVLAQWFWVRSLARGLEEEVGMVAVRVGETVASVIRDVEERDLGSGRVERTEVRRFVLREGGSGAAGAPDWDRLMRELEEARASGESESMSTTTEVILSSEGDRGAAEPPLDAPAEGDAEDAETSRRSDDTAPNVFVRSEWDRQGSWVFEVDEDGPSQRHLVLHLRTAGEVDGPGGAGDEEDGKDEVHSFSWTTRGEAGGDGTSDGTAVEVVDLRASGAPSSGGGSRRGLASAFPTVQKIPLPEGGIQDRLETFARRSLLGAGLLLTLSVGIAAVIAHRVSAPLRRLAGAAREVGGGALGRQVDVGRESGEVAEALASFNQMSRRLEQLDARTRALEKERQLAEIGEIARGLAHALRNPLNALGLAVEGMAATDDEDPATVRAAERARRQIRRVDAAVRSFLVLASEGAGEVERTDLAQLARDVALEARQDGAGRVRVTVEATATPLDAVEAELRAVLQALVVNAIEASPDGELVEVRVVEAAEGGARIEVADRGPGLPERIRERLFSPHLSTKSHGSGMGLFLAHRIATGRYRGSLELEDRDGGGTVATLRLVGRDARSAAGGDEEIGRG